MKKIVSLTLPALMILVMTSCGSQRAALDNNVSRRAIQEQYGACVQNAFNYDCLQLKGKVSLQGKTGLPMRMNMEEKETFKLQINAPLLGFEVGRLEVDKDSVTLVDKMDKLYTRQAISDFAFFTDNGIDVRTLQCVFMGRMCLPKQGECQVKDFSKFVWTKNDDGSIEGVRSEEKYNLSYRINEKGQVQQTHLVIPDKHVDVVWNYTEWYNVGVGCSPAKSHLSVKTSSSSYEVDFSYNQPNIDAQPWPRFEPSEKFKAMDPFELLEKVKNIKP